MNTQYSVEIDAVRHKNSSEPAGRWQVLSQQGEWCDLHISYSPEIITDKPNIYKLAPEMYAMLKESRRMLIAFHENTGSMGAINQCKLIDSLLAKARGEK